MTDEETVVLDGALDEAIWQRATPAGDFRQQDPLNGSASTMPTEVRIVYGRKALYIGVKCFDDEPTRLLRFQRRRDEFLSADDRFMWVLDPFLTAQNGYFFETNPSGLIADALISPAGQNRQWDGIWDLRVVRNELGWTLEIEIPFSSINFDPNATAWGINFQRTVRRSNEEMLWNGWQRNQGLQRLANTGLLQGLNQNVSQGIGLELRPYGVASSVASPATGQARAKNSAAAGLDLFYSLTPGLRANLTLNTDFAQTEVDQRLVNLTQFPLFLQERRTFFLEGANLLDFGSVTTGVGFAGGFNRGGDNSVVPFFSRRIGLDASGTPQPVDYGTKLIGQVGRFDVGVLQVRTGADADTDLVSEEFGVLRVKRRILRQSYVGGMYTLRDAHREGASALHTMGVDYQLATNRFKGSKNLSTSGFFLHNSNPRQTGKSSAYGLTVDYPNDRWNTGMAYRVVEPNFNPAVGFTLRNGYQRYNPYVNFSPRPNGHRYVRRLGFTADLDLQTDMDRRPLTRLVNLQLFGLELHTQDSFNAMMIVDHERLERDFRIYPGIALPAGGEYDFVRYRVGFNTAQRRLVSFNPTFEFGRFYSGTRRQMSANLNVRLRPGVMVYMSQEWNRVELAEGTFETTLFRMTPELQFSQWSSLVNTIQYDSVSKVLGWQARFRWILTPGNDLYFVYTHNWQDDPTLDRFTTQSRSAASKLLYTVRL